MNMLEEIRGRRRVTDMVDYAMWRTFEAGPGGISKEPYLVPAVEHDAQDAAMLAVCEAAADMDCQAWEDTADLLVQSLGEGFRETRCYKTLMAVRHALAALKECKDGD